VALRERTEECGDARPAVDFDAAWPAARARAAAALAARGVQRADADDVLQDVAVRALRRPDRFVSEEHFGRWCCRVALNLHVDGLRRRRHLSPLPPPDAADSADTAITGERRIALSRLVAGMAELSEEERRLLFNATPAASRQEAVRLAVRRHRLRARLAALVDGMAAGIAFLRRLPKRLPSAAKPALVAAPVVCATLLLGPLTMPARPDEPRRPLADPHATGVLPVPARQPARTRSTSTAAPPVVSRSSTPPKARPAAAPRAGSSARTIVAFDAGGQPFAARHWHNDGDLSICTTGVTNICISHPRPQIPSPTMPRLTRPGG